MTVYKIGRKRLKIALTDSEVISFFGTYRGLTSVNRNARLTVGLLLKQSLSEYDTELDGKLLVEIKAKEKSGCIITVSSADSSRRSSKSSTVMFESSLYKMSEKYRLIVTTRDNRDFFFMNEFCIRQSDSKTEAEYTAEYGKLICGKKAVGKIGKAFCRFT